MAYNTTGSSNSATSGGSLELEIKISPDSPGNNILLMGVFSIESLDSIATGKDLEKLTCNLFGKTIDATAQPGDNNQPAATNPVLLFEMEYKEIDAGKRSYIFSRTFNVALSYLILKISGANCTMQMPSTNLKISFKDKNNKDDQQAPVQNIIQFKVENVQAKPEIISFIADPTVLQGNNKPVTLSWKTKGENYTCTLREGLKELYKVNAANSKSDSKIDHVLIGDHTYTLELKQGNATVTKSKVVRALDGSQLSERGNPPWPGVIGNLCVSDDSDYLFSLILNKGDNNVAQIDYLGFNNEGFSGQWSRFELTKGDKENLKPFASSPMVHLKDAGEIYGRLVFAGGSYVRPLECSNAVAIVDLDQDLGLDAGADLSAITQSRVTVVRDLPWSSRMGHSCVVFPHGGNEEKIWILGGIDEWGVALNDVWVSGDGKTWNNINAGGTVNNNSEPEQMPWSARCLAGISVELSDNGSKKALWIGGGFSEIGGKETPDIWKWQTPGWTEIKPLKINGGSYLSSGLAFVGKDSLQSTGMYLLGGYEKFANNNLNKEKYFNKINLQGNNFTTSQLDTSAGVGSFGTTKNSRIYTGFFKGCLWFMVFTNEGDAGITYSKLYYWVPEVTGQTLILS